MWPAAIGVARQTVHRLVAAVRGRGVWRGLADRSARSRCRVRIRWRRRSRRGSWSCAGRIRGGGRARSCIWLEREGVVAVAGADVDLSVPGPSRADRRPQARQAQAGGLQAVGAVAGDGVVADGHRRRGPARRRQSRRRSCRGSMTTRGSCVSARVVARATARPVCDALALAMRTPRGARADPDRQRQGVHRPVRAGPGAGAVRSDLPGERHQAPPHRAAVADHDGQGRAVAQDAAPRVPRRQGVRLDRRRPGPARCVGASTTTTSGRISRSGGCRRSSGSGSPSHATSRPGDARRDRRTASGPVTTRRVERQGHDQLRHRRRTRPARGSPARPSRSSARAGSCSSTTAACSSPPTPAGTRSTSRPPASQRGRKPTAVTPVGVDRRVGDPQGRLVRQRLLRRHQLPGRQRRTGAARSKSPSSATPSRSRIGERAHPHATRSATTAPANTAPSPTPAADPTASTPPEGSTCQAATGAEVSGGYRGLTQRGRQTPKTGTWVLARAFHAGEPSGFEPHLLRRSLAVPATIGRPVVMTRLGVRRDGAARRFQSYGRVRQGWRSVPCGDD